MTTLKAFSHGIGTLYASSKSSSGGQRQAWCWGPGASRAGARCEQGAQRGGARCFASLQNRTGCLAEAQEFVKRNLESPTVFKACVLLAAH